MKLIVANATLVYYITGVAGKSQGETKKGDREMEKEQLKKDVLETVDEYCEAVTDRIAARMNQTEEHVEKDKSAAAKIIDKVIDTTEEYVDVVTDHFAERFNGEKLDL